MNPEDSRRPEAHAQQGAAPELPAEEVRAWLSALADGEADADEADRACAAWRADESARRQWHRYHLIGDALRSEELAREPARDAAFLGALRARLVGEPVVMAPMPQEVSASALHAPARPAVAVAARATGWRQAWVTPVAVAAGVAAVAGVLVVTRLGAPDSTGPVQARAASRGLTLATATATANPIAPSPARASSGPERDGVIRDAGIEAYFSAHQAARGGGVAAMPGVVLRQVDALAPSSPER
jgi:sigma-E factor negative regulatory protein RseA